jgi:uncharacterized repeat protein (TIGR01451 family)
VGQTVQFTFTVSYANTGDGSPINNITINDDVIGPVTSSPVISGDADAILEPGEVWTYTANYIVQVTDPDPLTNVGTVTGKDNDNDDVTANDSHNLDVGLTPAFIITKSGPVTATEGHPITYTLIVTNNGQAVANNLIITDAIPAGANYVSGGTRVGNLVKWTVPSLAPNTDVQAVFVVNASSNITNFDYGVVADGNVSAAGQKTVETTVVVPASDTRYVYLPLIFKPEPTELYVHNDSTGGNVTFTVLGTGVSCTVPNNKTRFCGTFPPGTYSVKVVSTCGNNTFTKSYGSGPQTTRVYCN